MKKMNETNSELWTSVRKLFFILWLSTIDVETDKTDVRLINVSFVFNMNLISSLTTHWVIELTHWPSLRIRWCNINKTSIDNQVHQTLNPKTNNTRLVSSRSIITIQFEADLSSVSFFRFSSFLDQSLRLIKRISIRTEETPTQRTSCNR